MLLAELAETSIAVARVSGRLDKVGRLADLIRGLAPAEVPVAIAALSGEPRQGRLGIGGSAIRQARDATPAREPTLTLLELDATFERITQARGPGSTAEKVRLLRDLLVRATPDEQDFVVRLLFGELRQGALEGVLVDAVAQAAALPAADVRRAAMLAGTLAEVATAALSDGADGLRRFAVRIFRPVQPMLADSAEDVAEAVGRVGDAAVEYKLDGARIQVHKAGDEVRVFSRQLRDVTAAVPEVVEAVQRLPSQSLVVDGEVIALRPDGRPQPFQVTMRRFVRKLDVATLRRELPLTPFFFDLLVHDSGSLLDCAQEDRFVELVRLAPSLVVPHVVRPSAAGADAFVQRAVTEGHEGVMVKALDSTYAAGRRGAAWLKVKQAHTLDLVVLAAEWGSGRRQGWLSNLHLGARDPGSGGFVMLGKTFKGLTDELLAWQTERLLGLEVARDAWTVFVRPELVVEIAFNDIQESPRYPGGLALRFARVRRYRTDKSAADADTIDTVRRLLP